jgi:heptosyltransferase-2
MYKRYLIIQTASLCGAILTEPLIETIKLNDKNSFITILVTPQTKEVFSANPNTDHIITYDKHGRDSGIAGFNRIIKALSEFNFDVILSAHESARTSLIAFFTNAKRKIGFSSSSLSFVYTDRVKKDKTKHELYKILQLAEPLNFKKSSDIKLYYSDESKKMIEGIFEAYSIKDSDIVVGLAISSLWPNKRWPKEYFKKLAISLTKKDITVLIIGMHKDEEIAKFIKDNNSKIINLSGRASLQDIFYITSKLSLIISNDSFLVHIASAYNIPTIDIYGPTSPDFGFYPLSDESKILEIKNLECRPCGKHGGISCNKRHFKCMIDIKPNLVLSSALQLLNKKGVKNG